MRKISLLSMFRPVPRPKPTRATFANWASFCHCYSWRFRREDTPKDRTRGVSLICLFITTAALSCATYPPMVLEDIEYIRQARDYQQQEKYKDARGEYQKVLENHPDSKYMAEARLGIADSYFNNKEHIEAVARYDEFLRYYPRNPLAEQAEFRLAKSHYEQRIEVDRDQSETRKTIEAFEKFTRDFPKAR